ncbi:hypothetical protein [Halomonas sp. 3D7M]|uniref:hypothetical protein n=1 Tax=Halomonas sp. 3D7M TaxID=2742617 RepID=UPI0018681453|nr:hypothetical protein [Halomonas sp. 3D7M]
MIEKPKKRVGRPLENDPNSINLVTTWKKIATRDCTLTAALDKLNQRLSIKTTPSRLSEWEIGTRTPSKAVINYMLEVTLFEIFRELDIDKGMAAPTIKKLMLPIIE